MHHLEPGCRFDLTAEGQTSTHQRSTSKDKRGNGGHQYEADTTLEANPSGQQTHSRHTLISSSLNHSFMRLRYISAEHLWQFSGPQPP